MLGSPVDSVGGAPRYGIGTAKTILDQRGYRQEVSASTPSSPQRLRALPNSFDDLKSGESATIWRIPRGVSNTYCEDPRLCVKDATLFGVPALLLRGPGICLSSFQGVLIIH